MGLASSCMHFPEDKLGTQEREITDQEYTPLFHTPKNKLCGRKSMHRVAFNTKYHLRCPYILLIQQKLKHLPLLVSVFSSLVVDFGDGGVSSKNKRK